MSRSLLTVLLVALSGATVADGASCERNDFGVFEDLNCAVQAAETADRDLNETYKRLLSLLSGEEAAALRKAQRSWLQFLAADALFTYAREGNGSSGRLIVINDRERLMRERTQALKSWIPK